MRSFPFPIPIIGGIVVSVLLWFALTAMGFASTFRYFYLGIVWIAVLLFLLLDAKPIKLQPDPKMNLAVAGGLILLFSGIVIAGGQFIPSAGKYLLPPDEVKYKGKTKVEVGQIVFLENCVYCHKAEGFTEKVGPGPELSEIGKVRDMETIKAKILNPAAYPAPGYEEEWKKRLMPGYYALKLTPSEIDALALFLSLTPASLPKGGHGGHEEGAGMEGRAMEEDYPHTEEEGHAAEEGHGMEMGEEMGHEMEEAAMLPGDGPFDLETHLAQKRELYVEEHHIFIRHGMRAPGGREYVEEVSSQEEVPPEFKLAVEVIKAQNCGACHTLKAKGLNLAGTVGPDLSEEGKMNRSDEWQLKHLKDPASVPKEDLIPEFRNKHGLMPSYAHLSDEELNALVAFLQSLGKEEK